MPFKTKEQRSEYNRKLYQQKTKIKKEKSKQYSQTYRDKKKMEQQENRDQLAELPTNADISRTALPRKPPPVTPPRISYQVPRSVLEDIRTTPYHLHTPHQNNVVDRLRDCQLGDEEVEEDALEVEFYRSQLERQQQIRAKKTAMVQASNSDVIELSKKMDARQSNMQEEINAEEKEQDFEARLHASVKKHKASAKKSTAQRRALGDSVQGLQVGDGGDATDQDNSWGLLSLFGSNRKGAPLSPEAKANVLTLAERRNEVAGTEDHDALDDASLIEETSGDGAANHGDDSSRDKIDKGSSVSSFASGGAAGALPKSMVTNIRNWVSPQKKLADQFDSAAIDGNQKTKSAGKEGVSLSQKDKLKIENVSNSIARRGGLCPETAMTKSDIRKPLGNGTKKELGDILEKGLEHGYLVKIANKNRKNSYKYYAVKYDIESDQE